MCPASLFRFGASNYEPETFFAKMLRERENNFSDPACNELCRLKICCARATGVTANKLLLNEIRVRVIINNYVQNSPRHASLLPHEKVTEEKSK